MKGILVGFSWLDSQGEEHDYIAQEECPLLPVVGQKIMVWENRSSHIPDPVLIGIVSGVELAYEESRFSKRWTAEVTLKDVEGEWKEGIPDEGGL